MTGADREIVFNPAGSRVTKAELVQGLRASGEVSTQRLDDLEDMTDEAWQEIIEALEDPLSLFNIDWSQPFTDDTQSILKRLSSLKTIHPENNIATKKLLHNISIENYAKMVLETAGDLSSLRIFLELVRSHLEDSSSNPVIAEQALLTWATAAEIGGWHELKTKLEESAFTRLYPDQKREIEDTYAHMGGDEALSRMIEQYEEDITAILEEHMEPGVTIAIFGRRKSSYSVWRKKVKYDTPSYTMPDFLGLRVLVNSDQDEESAITACYSVRDHLCQLFTPDPERIYDYIRSPQSDGYQSLHLTVMDLNQAQIELQIRTVLMDHRMETGLSVAHTVYDATQKITPGTYHEPNRTRSPRIYSWRAAAAQEIRERKEQGSESLKLLRPEEILVFAFDGNLYKLGKGDTALDFALTAIHSDFAYSVQSIFVNGLPAEFGQPLTFGQVIEVIRHRDRRPTWKDDWMNKVHSVEAKRRIRRVQKLRDQDQLVAKAKILLAEELRQKGLEIAPDSLSEEAKLAVMKRFGVASFDQVLSGIGARTEGFGVVRVANTIERQLVTKKNADTKVTRLGKTALEDVFTDSKGVVWEVAVLGTLGFKHRVAGCCLVAAGDEVVAIYSHLRGMLSLHKLGCVNTSNKHTLECSWHQIESRQ